MSLLFRRITTDPYQVRRSKKRQYEDHLNTNLKQILEARLALIESRLDVKKFKDDYYQILIEIILENKGIKFESEVQTDARWNKVNPNPVLVSTKKEVLKMETREKLELKLRLAGERGKNSASFKALRKLANERKKGKKLNVLENLDLVPPLSEEVVIGREE